MAKRLRGRYLAFKNAYIANGGDATKATITAGYSKKTASTKGSQLLTIVEIKEAIKESQNRATIKSEDKLVSQIEYTKDLRNRARKEHNDIKAELTANDQVSKLQGAYSPDKLQVELDHKNMTDEELRLRLEALRCKR